MRVSDGHTANISCATINLIIAERLKSIMLLIFAQFLNNILISLSNGRCCSSAATTPDYIPPSSSLYKTNVGTNRGGGISYNYMTNK